MSRMVRRFASPAICQSRERPRNALLRYGNDKIRSGGLAIRGDVQKATLSRGAAAELMRVARTGSVVGCLKTQKFLIMFRGDLGPYATSRVNGKSRSSSYSQRGHKNDRRS